MNEEETDYTQAVTPPLFEQSKGDFSKAGFFWGLVFGVLCFVPVGF